MDITQHMQLELDIRELEHLGGTYTGTIKTVEMEKTSSGDLCITFEETPHYCYPWECLKRDLRYLYGDETEAWIGERLTLTFAWVSVDQEDSDEYALLEDGDEDTRINYEFYEMSRTPQMRVARAGSAHPTAVPDAERAAS
jgi:hypothetical protein